MPTISALLAQARKVGATIVYGTRAANMSTWLPEVSPAPGDIKIENHAQDRFYNTDLDQALKAKGITTLILTGWKVSGSVTYTSVGATLRGYTVVVPIDATLDATEYEIVIGKFQILNQNSSNAANEALKNRASTLSRTDLIIFKSRRRRFFLHVSMVLSGPKRRCRRDPVAAHRLRHQGRRRRRRHPAAGRHLQCGERCPAWTWRRIQRDAADAAPAGACAV